MEVDTNEDDAVDEKMFLREALSRLDEIEWPFVMMDLLALHTTVEAFHVRSLVAKQWNLQIQRPTGQNSISQSRTGLRPYSVLTGYQQK